MGSALSSQLQAFDNKDVYKTIEEKAARLCISLIDNHAFFDGNKRIGILVLLVYLEFNNIKISYTDDELIYIGLGLAGGNVNVDEVLKWSVGHSK